MDEPSRKTRPRRGPRITSTDPVELALEGGGDPALRLIDRQTVLVDEQIGLARNERFRNRIKAARDAALTVLVVALLFAIGWVVWDASRADGVVIESFTVDPALTSPELNGQILAHRLLIKLSGMEALAPSLRRGKETRDSSDEISVEIPETGVSLGEILRLLRRRLGHETIVNGELAKAPDGTLNLIVRIDGAPYTLPRPGQPPSSSVEGLINQAAEGLFERTDTYRYAVWLNATPGRLEDAERQFRRLSLRGSPQDRAWAFSAMSVQSRTRGDLGTAIRRAQEATRLDPSLPNGWLNLQVACDTVDRLQCVREADRRILALVGRKNDLGSKSFRLQAQVAEANYGRDPQALLRLAEQTVALAQADAAAMQGQGLRADAFVALHQTTDADAVMAQLPQAGPGDPGRKLRALARQQTLQDWRALEAEARLPGPDLTPAGREVAALFTDLQADILAYALARQGRAAEAQAVLAAVPSPPADCYSCLDLRGQIAAWSRDWSGADRWFAQATASAPDLPQAELDWGLSHALRGDTGRAIAHYRLAVAKAPNWADPLKAWGDALAQQNDLNAAIGRYRKAALLAPRWGALHLAWARALDRLGKSQAAMAEYRLAQGMDLSLQDRAALQRRLASKPRT